VAMRARGRRGVFVGQERRRARELKA
jgi:hypothetical protein